MTYLPDWWQSVVLALGTWRAVRLIAFDTFPPIVRVRDWATGAEWHIDGPDSADEPGHWEYRNQFLADLLACAFCLGLWISGGVYAAWLLWPHATVYAAFPLALSAVVGLIATNLD